MNKNITYKIIDALSLKYAERKCSTFAGDVHIIFNKSKSSDNDFLNPVTTFKILKGRDIVSTLDIVFI